MQQQKRQKSKMNKEFEWTFTQRKYTNGQEAHEKMFNIISYEGNGLQNYKIPLHDLGLWGSAVLSASGFKKITCSLQIKSPFLL